VSGDHRDTALAVAGQRRATLCDTVAEDDAASQAEASRQTKRYSTGSGLFSSSMFTTDHFHTL